ncbi:zf-HC2 domain-containing protein [bacterium]|nr:zf-HC2 domain-containing protein [bacterium]
MNRTNKHKPDSFTCNEAQSYLPDYLDKSLNQSRHLGLEAHLKECASCRLELDELRKTLGLLKLRSLEEPQDAFFRDLRGQVHRKIAARRRWTLSDLAPKPALSPVFAAAAMLLFLLLWWTLPNAQKGTELQPFLAQIEQEATNSLMDLSLDLAGGATEIIDDLLPSAGSDKLIANLSESELERLAERLEAIMG